MSKCRARRDCEACLNVREREMSCGTHACEACGSRGSNVRHRTRTKSGPRLGKERPPVTSRDLASGSKVEFLPWPTPFCSVPVSFFAILQMKDGLLMTILFRCTSGDGILAELLGLTHHRGTRDNCQTQLSHAKMVQLRAKRRRREADRPFQKQKQICQVLCCVDRSERGHEHIVTGVYTHANSCAAQKTHRSTKGDTQEWEHVVSHPQDCVQRREDDVIVPFQELLEEQLKSGLLV